MQTAQTKKEQDELSRLRSLKVVKANAIIQKARFRLTVQEQKIILYLISKIKPEDTEFHKYDFQITDFCRICGIDYDNGGNYKTVKDTIKKLSDKSLWVVLNESGVETLVRWINKAWVIPKSGMIKLRLDEDMKPYLLQLQDRFTQYELFYTLGMKSQYSIRLYELLKSYEGLREWTMTLEELRRRLDAENYTRYQDVRRKVLDVAMKEINELSDIRVTYEPLKTGRSYTDIHFAIRTADAGERWDTVRHVSGILDREAEPEQISLFEQPDAEPTPEPRRRKPKPKPERGEPKIIDLAPVPEPPIDAEPPKPDVAPKPPTAKKKSRFAQAFEILVGGKAEQ